MSDLAYDTAELAAARAIAVMVPGALSRRDIFDPALAWRDHGVGLAFYRFPGLDGRPAQPPLKIADAAKEIVDLATRFPDKPIWLLGYSTGGPVALSAAALIDRDVTVALMCPALEGGGGLRTGLEGVGDIARAAARCKSIDIREVWLRYYRVLLFGRQVEQDPGLAARAQTLIDARRERIVFPTGGLPRAHTDDLRNWRLPEGLAQRPGPDRIKLFIGAEDPVFAPARMYALARQLGGAGVQSYAGHAHLLFLTCDRVFSDILAFFEAASVGKH